MVWHKIPARRAVVSESLMKSVQHFKGPGLRCVDIRAGGGSLGIHAGSIFVVGHILGSFVCKVEATL
jgi:hypothetical protein